MAKLLMHRMQRSNFIRIVDDKSNKKCTVLLIGFIIRCKGTEKFADTQTMVFEMVNYL